MVNNTVGSLERVPSGIKGLDSMMDGGFPKNSSIMIRGGTGTGKTLLCLQYLYNGAQEHDDAGVFISFAESIWALHEHGRRLGWDLEALEKKNKLTIIRYEPHEVMKVMEEGGGSIRDTVEAIGTKRLVIDSISAYEMLFEQHYKANESVLSLFEMLKGWNTTTLVTAETPIVPSNQGRERIGFLSDGIINMYYLRHGDRRVRALEIIKMRDTAHTDEVKKFTIDSKGIVVSGRLSNIEQY